MNYNVNKIGDKVVITETESECQELKVDSIGTIVDIRYNDGLNGYNEYFYSVKGECNNIERTIVRELLESDFYPYVEEKKAKKKLQRCTFQKGSRVSYKGKNGTVDMVRTTGKGYAFLYIIWDNGKTFISNNCAFGLLKKTFKYRNNKKVK